LCADQGRLGALSGGGRSLHGASPDRRPVGDVWLLVDGKAEHHPGLVERNLLNISAFLGVIKSLLIDVAVQLLAVDPRLTIIKDRRHPMILNGARMTLFVMTKLTLIDADLVTIAGQLLTITERLLKLGQALFPGQLLSTSWLANRIGHARLRLS
jgi:hypothetical protein